MLLHPHQSHWAADFETIATELRTVLGVDTRIEHVGSTSVTGLLAKPIIDVDLVYADLKSWHMMKAGLHQLGYEHYGDQGITGREVFKRRSGATPHPILDYTSHHLYACPASGRELERHLLFRDALRINNRARTAYANIKREIADQSGDDRKVYASLKEEAASELIERIIAGNAEDELMRVY